MKASKALADALNMFGKDGKKWVNHAPDHRKHCAVTAISFVCYNVSSLTQHRALKFLKRAAKIRQPEGMLTTDVIIYWNDHSTWPKVRAAFNLAIKLAKAKGD